MKQNYDIKYKNMHLVKCDVKKKEKEMKKQQDAMKMKKKCGLVAAGLGFCAGCARATGLCLDMLGIP